MLRYISEITKIDSLNHIVYCKFNNEDDVRCIDLDFLIKQYALTPVINSLQQPKVFSQVFLDSYGTLAWPNGVDFCPDVLYGMSEACQLV